VDLSNTNCGVSGNLELSEEKEEICRGDEQCDTLKNLSRRSLLNESSTNVAQKTLHTVPERWSSEKVSPWG
jgi:hypothetical protein